MSEVPTVDLSPDETRPAIDPDDTTMWSVTERNNYTSTDSDESPPSTITESSDSLALNETTTPKYPPTTASNLEGLDYKQSKLIFPFHHRMHSIISA